MPDETPSEPIEAPEPVEPTVAAIDEAHEPLLAAIRAALGDGVIEAASNHGDLVIRVQPTSWEKAAITAKTQLSCDFLSFVAGIDWLPMPVREGAGGDTSQPTQPSEQTPGVAGASGRFQVMAHVQSTTNHYGITFKTDVAEDNAAVDSWVATYPGADWHERETWEMYGINFVGHPAMRHLYLPNDFEGHPLRKDFPLLAREVKPWPGIVNVEPMPGEGDDAATEESA